MAPAETTSRVEELISEIADSFNDDLDTPRAMILLRGIERAELSAGEKRALFESLDPLFGLNLLLPQERKELTSELKILLEERAIARSNRDFKASDRLRDTLAKFGVEVRDTAQGQEWDWKIN
jgi:cysteinyl-tRNA synthetase